MQDTVVHEEAEQQLLNAIQDEAYNGNYYADLFLMDDHKHITASIQVKDGINRGRIPSTGSYSTVSQQQILLEP